MEQETQTLNEKTGMSKKTKVLVGTLVAIMGFSAWTWWFYVLHAPERDVQKFFAFWQWRLHSYGLKIAYESDTYGGETPEETVRLFTEAVAAHDPELASKYFVPRMQKEMEEKLEKGVKNGGLDRYAEYLRAMTYLSYSSTTGKAFISSVDEMNVVNMEMILVQNPATGKWKIEEE